MIGRTNGVGGKNLLLDASSLKTVNTDTVPSGQAVNAVFTNMDLSHRYWLFNYIAFGPSENIYVSTSGILDMKLRKMRVITYNSLGGNKRLVDNDFNVTIDDAAMTVTIRGQTHNQGYYSLAKIEGLN